MLFSKSNLLFFLVKQYKKNNLLTLNHPYLTIFNQVCAINSAPANEGCTPSGAQ